MVSARWRILDTSPLGDVKDKEESLPLLGTKLHEKSVIIVIEAVYSRDFRDFHGNGNVSTS